VARREGAHGQERQGGARGRRGGEPLMKIHEYQGKEILRQYGVPVPVGGAAMSVEEADAAVGQVMEQTGGRVVGVKAQLHRGGGVKVAKGKEAAREAIRKIFGMQLVTHQTGPEGKKVQRLLVEQGLDIARELYLGMTLDRAAGRVVVMASTEGGMEIEEVAAKHPEKILREAIHPAGGWQAYQARARVFRLGLAGGEVAASVKFCDALVRAYFDSDGSLAEINPLVVTKQGQVLALAAKINFDDNALFRH